MGITTFISEVLREGRPFNRRDPLARRCKKNKGQNIGRRLDARVRAQIDAHTGNTLIKVPINAGNSAIEKRTISVFRCLRRHNVFPVLAQTLVRDNDLGIRSYSDAIGMSLEGEVVIIELKATSVSLSHHRQIYETPASKTPLRNGLPDTEEMHHKLQAGFGVLAAKKTFPALSTFRRVRACVIVSCSDGCELYWVQERFFSHLLFQVSRDHQVSVPKERRPSRNPAKKIKSLPKVIMMPWPMLAPGLVRALPNFGYVSSVDQDPSSALGLLHPINGNSSVGLSIVITRPWHTLSASMQTSISTYVKAKASKHTALNNAKRVLGLVIYPNGQGQWNITRVTNVVVASNVV